MHRVQKKLYKAYGKVAKKLGEEFEIFRPDPFVLRLTDANYLDTKYVSVSNDNSYNSNGDDSKRKLWVDGRLEDLFDIQCGDYMINRETDQALFVSKKDLNLPLEVVECNARVTISKTTSASYEDTGSGWGVNATPDNIDIARDLPAYVHAVGATAIDGGFIPARTSYDASHNTYKVMLALPEGLVMNGCVITHGSVKISAQHVHYDDGVYTIMGVNVQ